METFKYKPIHRLLIHIIRNFKGDVTKTKLVKLCYLVDLRAKHKTGETLSGLKYISYHYGPYAPEISQALKDLKGFEIDEVVFQTAYASPFEPIGYCYLPGRFHRGNPNLKPDEKELAEAVLKEYADSNLQTILEKVYSTKEFKQKKFGEVVLQ